MSTGTSHTSNPAKKWVVAFVYALAFACGLGAVCIAQLLNAEPFAVIAAGGTTLVAAASLFLATTKALGLTD
ncbi:hypothetical protein TPA0906_50200 [Streptomyces olivaceus]|nr:hypothetical protein TPA0906_50200 [Streptomyces olivaceus]